MGVDRRVRNRRAAHIHRGSATTGDPRSRLAFGPPAGSTLIPEKRNRLPARAIYALPVSDAQTKLTATDAVEAVNGTATGPPGFSVSIMHSSLRSRITPAALPPGLWKKTLLCLEIDEAIWELRTALLFPLECQSCLAFSSHPPPKTQICGTRNLSVRLATLCYAGGSAIPAR